MWPSGAIGSDEFDFLVSISKGSRKQLLCIIRSEARDTTTLQNAMELRHHIEDMYFIVRAVFY
jgi:hypothetical protein